MIIFDEYIEYSDNYFCSYELQIFSFFTLIALSASSVLAIGSYDIIVTLGSHWGHVLK